MDRKRPKTYKTIAFRVSALVLSIWIVFMFCLTWAVAQDFQRQMRAKGREFVEYDIPIHYVSFDQTELPGYQDGLRILQLGAPYTLLQTEKLFPFVLDQIPDGYDSDSWIWEKWELLYGFQPALIFYDETGKVTVKSGNLLSFTYCREETWIAKTPEIHGYGYIELDAMDSGQEKISGSLWGWPSAWAPSDFCSPLLRMTGWFEGSRFHPVSIDRAYDSFMGEDLPPERFARRDSLDLLDWEHVYDEKAPENAELTTIYSWETGGIEYRLSPLTVRGVQYDSLVAYLEAAMEDEDWYDYRQESLVNDIQILRGTMDDEPEGAYYAVAVHSKPLRYAFLRLIPTYLVSFSLVALALWRILRAIKHNVTDTVEMLVHRITTDAPIEHLSRWREPYELETVLKDQQQERRRLVNENQQLMASLDFAKNAEENRRQLLSNITHELKTPLAIIHSYAEGLQSGTAGEKTERYLATILEETERMDAMVLEILDHSRLEAGKVKFSADYFSLLKLTEGIVEKLMPAAEERKLTFDWGFHNDCFLTADEARLSQVVTNLVSNAIRYAPEGTKIWLRVFSNAKEATFQIENAGTHLPEAVLEKLFDSFYRAEESRTGKGTGLGLSIAKSIVELHRGQIKAVNTRDNGISCVQFMFTIPLK